MNNPYRAYWEKAQEQSLKLAQFYTPECLVDLCLELLQPKGELFDPCCGLGSFLLKAICDKKNWIKADLKKIEENNFITAPKHYEPFEEKVMSEGEIDQTMKATIAELYYCEYKCYKNHEIGLENMKRLAAMEGFFDINWQGIEDKLATEIKSSTTRTKQPDYEPRK